jgi:hypothetical protein
MARDEEDNAPADKLTKNPAAATGRSSSVVASAHRQIEKELRSNFRGEVNSWRNNQQPRTSHHYRCRGHWAASPHFCSSASLWAMEAYDNGWLARCWCLAVSCANLSFMILIWKQTNGSKLEHAQLILIR